MGAFHPLVGRVDARGKVKKLMPDLALFVIGVLVSAVVAVAVAMVGLSDLPE